MIKVINVRLANYCWEYEAISDDYCYYECPALNKFIDDGYAIKDFKIANDNCIFILEKPDKKEKKKKKDE